MKKAFTLIEMLVVIGIIVVLSSASVAAMSKIRASAEKARAKELVSQTATALAAIFSSEGVWPPAIREQSEGEGLIDNKVAYQIAKRGLMSITYDSSTRQSTGLDRFGIVSPWATDVLKKAGTTASESLRVGAGKDGKGTIKDHILRFKVDLDGDGIIDGLSVDGNGGTPVRVRATVAVWCAGKDGKLESTYEKGCRNDDVYSWVPGQMRNVNQ